MTPVQRLRRRAGAVILDGMFRGLATVGKLHPLANPARHRVQVLRDVPYRPTGRAEHRLDIYRPTDAQGPTPTVLYVHGGGFRILSKDTHWVMALAFARRGYTVFNISYRLAPADPFPAAVEDTCAALVWLAEHGPGYGADLDRLVFAGESAGANLVTGLTVATCYRRPEPYARAAFDTGLVPRVTLPACGMLQVTDPGRMRRRKPRMSAFLDDRLQEVSEHYLGSTAHDPVLLDLADPLHVFERGDTPARPLPAFFAPVGTRDPLLDDTRRLHRALQALGVPCEVQYYPGEVHAFHALVFRPEARRCWQDTFAFLGQHVAPTVEPLVRFG